MSIRITNDQATGVASSQSSRAENVVASAANGLKSRTVPGNLGQDQIEVSSVTEAIVAGVSTHNLQQSDKVRQLGILYASGRYEADSVQVSQSLVANSLNRGTGEG